jgi:uncharacterized protein (DUF1330 family)
MPALLIAVLDVHDADGIAEYIRMAAPTLGGGAKIHAIDENPEIIEGSWPGARTVVLEFPSREALKAWYESPEYQAAAKVRSQAATTAMVAVDTCAG